VSKTRRTSTRKTTETHLLRELGSVLDEASQHSLSVPLSLVLRGPLTRRARHTPHARCIVSHELLSSQPIRRSEDRELVRRFRILVFLEVFFWCSRRRRWGWKWLESKFGVSKKAEGELGVGGDAREDTAGKEEWERRLEF